jgi:hypothetical protein
MKNTLKILLYLFGVIMIYVGISSHDIWGVILGVSMLFVPFSAFSMFLAYLLYLVVFFTPILLGAYIGVQVTGKDNIIGAFCGIILGGIISWRILTSNFADIISKLVEPIRKLGDKK